MKIVRNALFPLAMVFGILLSAFVIVNSLQAASSTNPTTIIAPKTVPTQNAAAQGRALLLAKGCLVCHRHGAMEKERAAFADFYFENAPNLARLQADPQYIARWLENPQAVKPDAAMPNLNLSASEIAVLVAFLTQKQ